MLKGLYIYPMSVGPVHTITISIPWGTYSPAAIFSAHDFFVHIAILPTHVTIYGWVNQCSVLEGFATLAHSNPIEGRVSLCQPEPGPGLEPPTLGSPVEHDQHWLWPTPCALGH